MESPIPAAKPQRSPWFYVALGCGGFALITCLGVVGAVGACGLKLKDIGEGAMDPARRQEKAKEMLGDIPAGYYAGPAVGLGLVDMAVLTDAPPEEDGGLTVGEHIFQYRRLFANEQNELTKQFFAKEDGDPAVLEPHGIRLNPNAILKRGSLAVAGRTLKYVVVRGSGGSGFRGSDEQDGLATLILFGCEDKALHLGLWAQRSAQPGVAKESLDLTGTVADEAELARFLKPINPCGK